MQKLVADSSEVRRVHFDLQNENSEEGCNKGFVFVAAGCVRGKSQDSVCDEWDLR